MTDSWKLYEYELTFEDNKVIDKIGLQFGGTPNSILYLDDFKFGKKIEKQPTKWSILFLVIIQTLKEVP